MSIVDINFDRTQDSHKKLYLYLNNLKPSTYTPHLTTLLSDTQFFDMQEYADNGIDGVDFNAREGMEFSARYHIDNMAMPLFHTLGKIVNSYTLTVDDVRTLAQRVHETDKKGRPVPYPHQGEAINEKNYLGVAAHILMAIGADMTDSRIYSFTGYGTKDKHNKPLQLTSYTGEPLTFNAYGVFEPQPPKKPNIFKRALNSVFGAFQKEIDFYNDNYRKYEENCAIFAADVPTREEFLDTVKNEKDKLLDDVAVEAAEITKRFEEAELEHADTVWRMEAYKNGTLENDRVDALNASAADWGKKKAPKEVEEPVKTSEEINERMDFSDIEAEEQVTKKPAQKTALRPKLMTRAQKAKLAETEKKGPEMSGGR